MTNEGKQTNNAGPEGIPQRGNTGVPEPSRTAPQADHAMPVPEGNGPVNDELEWARKHVPGKRTKQRPAQSVFRKTELRGIAPPTEPYAIKKSRQRILKNIRDPDGEVAYRVFEDAFRDFTCSLVERQDKVYDEMLLHVADLQQQIDAIENRIEESRRATPDGLEVKG